MRQRRYQFSHTVHIWMKSTKKTWRERRNDTQEVHDRKQIDGCLRL